MMLHRKMRIAIAASLDISLAWTSALGAMHSVVLCFYADGERRPHVERLAMDDAASGVECVLSETLICGIDYPPCTDLVLKSAEMFPARPVNSGSGYLLPLVAFSGAQPVTESSFFPELAGGDSIPALRLAHTEPAAELVSRIVVLRI